jgi:hypothetical protein
MLDQSERIGVTRNLNDPKFLQTGGVVESRPLLTFGVGMLIVAHLMLAAVCL